MSKQPNFGNIYEPIFSIYQNMQIYIPREVKAKLITIENVSHSVEDLHLLAKLNSNDALSQLLIG